MSKDFWSRVDVRDMKLKQRANRPAGSKNGRAVLDAASVRAIRGDGRFNTVIAAEFGVSKAAVQRIKSGMAWASIA